MGFKLNGTPYNKDDMNIPVYKRRLEDGAVGKSNHTGIIVQQGLDKQTEDAVVAHETVHQKDPHLDYDDENFYYKGKTYPRNEINEFDRNLPWEKKAYKESDKILKQKSNNVEMKQKFKMDGKHKGGSKPFVAMAEKGLVGPSMEYTVSDGASAGMCGLGGGDDECKAFTDKKLDKKVRVKRSKKPKTVKRRGTLEKKSYVQTETIPGETVSVSQTTSGGKTTDWRNSEDHKNVKDFKDDVNKTNVVKSDIGSKAAKHIKQDVTRQTLREDNLTRRNKKGKAKYSVKRTGYGEKGERATMRNPDALVTRKDRLIGKDKVRSYTTNEAHGSKHNKLVSKKKMKKLAARATKNLTKGKPRKVDAPKPKKSKSSSSSMMRGM